MDGIESLDIGLQDSCIESEFVGDVVELLRINFRYCIFIPIENILDILIHIRIYCNIPRVSPIENHEPCFQKEYDKKDYMIDRDSTDDNRNNPDDHR